MKAFRYAVGTLAALLVAGFPFLALTYSTGAPSGFSGPEQNCSACHNTFGEANVGTGAVIVTAPTTFTPGVPVEVTVHVVNTTLPEPVNKQGFQVSVRDASDPATYVGSFVVDGTTVQYAQGQLDFVTHTEASNMSTSWSFQWVPPATGAPAAVTLYAAGNAANGNLDNTGDYIYTTTVTMDRVNVAAAPGPEVAAVRLGPVAPNPVRAAASVALTLDRPSGVVARLLDAQGRVVRTVADGEHGAGRTLLRVETEGLVAGAYVLQVEAANARAARSFTVVR